MTDLTEVLVGLDEADHAMQHVISAVRDCSAADLRAPSVLPEWTRGHVLAHIDGVARAYARQVTAAADGRRTAVYDGGRRGRAEAIEAGSTRSTAEHLQALRGALDLHRSIWPGWQADLWHAPVTYRDGSVIDVALGWWREVSIHLVDLDLGVQAEDAWSQGLQEHLLDFLSVRLPHGPRVELDGFDPSVRYVVGAGADSFAEPAVTVTGPLASITGWLAGRTVHPLPIATSGDQTVGLPELGPWPSR